jgi:N-acetyl-anhydromuramyl-L-alanine amidase AmpD
MITLDIINDTKYKLSKKNYIADEFSKLQIILANTFNTNMQHFEGWTRRNNGAYKKTAPFTIDIKGNIYQHYDPKYHSKYLGIKGVDEISIPILIENEGWLTMDVQNNVFIDWVGNIYNREDEVVDRKWRDFQYWAPYTDEQLDSTVNLVRFLCEEHNIPFKCVSHIARIEDPDTEVGVLYKSNYNFYYTDLSPAWDCTEFKNKIEIN